MIKRHAPTAARILVGLVFFVFGLNGFLHFASQPPPPPAGGAFLGALFATGYMFPLIKGIEVVAGAMLLGNRFVPLALTLLAPIVVNIAAYHLILDFNAGMVVPLVALMGYLAWSYRASFRGVLAAKASPASAGEAPVVLPAGAEASRA